MTDYKTFYYSLVRFVPDRIRGESVNLGVVVVAESEESGAEFLPRFKSRIRTLDPWVDASVIERLIDTIKERVGIQRVSLLVSDSQIKSKTHLQLMSDSMKNQLQISEPRPYRSVSLHQALQDLFAELVSPQRKPPSTETTITLLELRRLIRRTIQTWGTDAIRIEGAKLARGREAHHYADFWLEGGSPLAAFIAMPDDPQESHIAWARRDSVPTIADEFRSLNPRFKTVVVFPPSGHYPPKAFVSETQDLLEGVEGVILTHADELAAHRSEIAAAML